MKLLNKILAFLIVAFVLAALFGCGGSDEPIDEAPEQHIPTPVHAPACQASATCL